MSAHSSDRVAALAGVRSGTLAETPGCTLSSGDVLDGGYDRQFAPTRYTEVIG